MPRKKNIDNNGEQPIVKNKKNIMNTMVKNNDKEEQHIILQLPLNQNNIENIINKSKDKTEPIPYEKKCCFNSDNKILEEYFSDDKNNKNTDINYDNKNSYCFWCIHPIEYKVYGMPINYNNITNTYLCHSSFCSLQCANAYNFSINSGSDKVWEINSLIQMMGKLYNYSLPIRPAPSRYLLNIFNGGTLSIEEYRKLHLDCDTSHIINLPPMINISCGYEILNTSYIKSLSDNIKNSVITTQLNQNNDKNINNKMNLIIN